MLIVKFKITGITVIDGFSAADLDNIMVCKIIISLLKQKLSIPS